MIRWFLLLALFILCFFVPGTAAKETPATSVCIDTGLSGPARQENDMYCANGTQLAWSTYQAAIGLAQIKHIIVGTPTSIVQTVDWDNVPYTKVTFTSGYTCGHHSTGVVSCYAPGDKVGVWP